MYRDTGREKVVNILTLQGYNEKIETYLLANDIKMCTGNFIGDVPNVQDEQYNSAQFRILLKNLATCTSLIFM